MSRCITKHSNKSQHTHAHAHPHATTVKEKDLGIRADMKVSEQCGIADSKGNNILGLIMINITYKEKS